MWYSLSNERRGKCYFASLYGLSPLLPVSHPPIHPPHTHPSISAILKGVRDSGRDTCATGNVDHVTFRKNTCGKVREEERTLSAVGKRDNKASHQQLAENSYSSKWITDVRGSPSRGNQCTWTTFTVICNQRGRWLFPQPHLACASQLPSMQHL